MDFSNRRWIVEKLDLDFRRNRLFLLVILSSDLEGVLNLNKTRELISPLELASDEHNPR